jgi:hypothetical protein
MVASLALSGALAGQALAGPYTRLLVLLPGETAAPGTSTGKTGAAKAQTAGVPFTITVRACDTGWNTVATVTDAIQVLCSDASATLPAPAQLQAGQQQYTVTLNAGGTFTVYAHDQSDATIPDGTSSPLTSLVLSGFDISSIGKRQDAGTPVTVTITARDPRGALVSGFTGAVNLRELTSFGEGRVAPEQVNFSAGTWSGPVTFFRADETNHPRGNVYLQAELAAAPSMNGASNPFLVYAGGFARVQIVVPGQTPLPGSVSGLTGSPASQSAGRGFPVGVYATDNWWNPVGGGDNVRITSTDPAASTPVSGSLSNGFRQFTVTLNTVGTQRLTVSDLSAPSRTGMTTADIAVIPNATSGFAIGTVSSPQTAGVPVTVTIRATDASGNTIPNYAGDANLAANTGAGSIDPERITFANGQWTGPVTFRGAGGAVRFTCSDFSVPPHTGASNSFTVQPGPFTGLQVLLPGETALGGTLAGKSGTPTTQSAGALFTLTVRAVDAYWNMVSGVRDSIRLGSDDAFAAMPAETTLANGQVLIPTRLYKSGQTRIWASDPVTAGIRPDTSSVVTVTGGPFARVLILAPGESPAPGTATGRTGTATDQSINYAFTVRVLATDSWWNPVGGVSDVVHVTSGDPLARLPRDTTLTDGAADMALRLATGGFQQISVSDVTDPSKTGSTTQVRAISSGFHLEASASPASVKAGQPFTLTVRVTNDAGSVIQEINSFVTVEVQRAADRAPGRGTLLTTQFQLLQGQRSVSETYTFAEDIVMVAQDDAGNAPGITGTVAVTPGDPAALHLTSDPSWVGGNKHATLTARLTDAYDNGVPDQAVVFSVLSGRGAVTSIDSLTASDGRARADFLSPREPEHDLVRASAGSLAGDLDLQVAFVDPNAAGGTVTNYPNPFHPPAEGTTISYRLDDNADVRIRIFTLGGELVRDENLVRLAPGGLTGLNEWVWDGRNGSGRVVASGGYVALIEAQGQGQTMHVMRRKIAVVR